MLRKLLSNWFMSYFEELYKTKISKDLAKKYNITNPHCIPYIEKVVVSAGLGKDGGDKKVFEGTITSSPSPIPSALRIK